MLICMYFAEAGIILLLFPLALVNERHSLIIVKSENAKKCSSVRFLPMPQQIWEEGSKFQYF